MSLFKICTWWSTQCADLEDNYDVASLLCARFGLLDHEKDYVVVSSHGGHLSIYYPNTDVERNEAADGAGYKPTDLLLETKLKNPILGIYAGKFSSNNRDEHANQLAILHPNSLNIYNLRTLDGVAEHGTQASLHLLVEHTFERAAFSMCMGHFGQVKGREFFCIVHLDGTLTFYEQDGIFYECQFPGHRPLPAPVVYCERTDSFIRFGATWTLECYTYQDLSHSSINKSNYQPIWSVCLGEGILDISVVQAKENSSSIMILGERNFICLNDSGKIVFILKLDFVPRCFYSFVVGYYWEPNARLITAIVSETSKLYIYEETNLIWAAQLQHEPPVAMRRSNLTGLPGAIVTLGANGQLTVGFLGAESHTFTVPPLNVQNMNFQQAYKELLQLEDEIKESIDMGDRELVNQRAIDELRLTFDIEQDIIEDFDGLLLDVPADVAVKELPACKGTLMWKSKLSLAELQLTFNMPEGIRCSQETLTYLDIEAGTKKTLELEFYIVELLHMHTTRIEVLASSISTQGIPRVVQQTSHLPLKMFFKPKLPQKSAALKLTFSIETRAFEPKLMTFFPEFVKEQGENALGLVLLCPASGKTDEVITIVAAKNSNRIRIQSDSLEAFPMILERLINTSKAQCKMEQKAAKAQSKDAINAVSRIIKATPTMPTHEILHRIDLHREIQENIRAQTLLMDDLWKQFKTLQRKLQEKSDDEPKETLVMQIEQNYDHLIAEGDKLMEMRSAEKRQRCDLSCALTVANMIITCLPLEEKIINIVSSVLCTPIEDWTELSWEESMLPGIDMLHHYGPLNRSKSNASNAVADSNTSHEIFDYQRFRRHFATFFERIVRLAAIVEDVTPATAQKATESVTSTDANPLLDIGNYITGQENLGKIKSKSQEHLGKSHTLEAVQDDEDEYDEDDLRQVGKNSEYEKQKSSESSEWVNENFELPSSEELFNDLGIWW